MSHQPASILSPSDGITPKGEKVPLTSERALAEFRVACEIWMSQMTPDDRLQAVEHAQKTQGFLTHGEARSSR